MSPRRRAAPNKRPLADSQPRVIGGSLRGSKLPFFPDGRTRPMKHRTREAVFSILGSACEGATAVDLFAGSGALGFEALSRGATRAVFVEADRATTAAIAAAARSLGVADQCEAISADAMRYFVDRTPPTDAPWLVFVCPPYALYDDEPARMDALLARVSERAPPHSLLIVETPLEYELARLSDSAWDWDVRRYPPALVAIGELVENDDPPN